MKNFTAITFSHLGLWIATSPVHFWNTVQREELSRVDCWAPQLACGDLGLLRSTIRNSAGPQHASMHMGAGISDRPSMGAAIDKLRQVFGGIR